MFIRRADRLHTLCTLLTIGLIGACLACPLAAAEPATAAAPVVVERLGDEATQALHKLYDYDKSIPLEARTVERREFDGFVREKIVFRGVQGFLVPGYLQFPKNHAGGERVRCVLLLHGWSGSKENWWVDDNYISGGNVRKALLDKGYAVFALDAQCHGDRIAQNDFAPVNHYAAEGDPQPRKGYFTLPEIYLQTVRDYRRAIDYLETRGDIDAARIGVLGYSMGGTQTYALTGVEPRVKAAVAVAAPAENSKFSPVAPQNFLAGIGDRPFLEIMGTEDELCPLEHAEARYVLAGGRVSLQQSVVEGGHKLPRSWVAVGVDWLDSRL